MANAPWLTTPRAILLGSVLVALAILVAPTLRPSPRYQYSGGVLLDTETGRVWKCYTMKDGEVACRLRDAARDPSDDP